MIDLGTPVQFVKGVGPRIAALLQTKDITTLEDLLYYLPFRYEDRLNPRQIAELKPGKMASIIAEVRTFGLFRTRQKGVAIFQLTVGQGRTALKCLWFHGTYLKDRFKPGQTIALYGKVEGGRGGLQIIQPQFEILGEPEQFSADRAETAAASSLEIGRIVPIYESAAHGKLGSRSFRHIIHRALEMVAPENSANLENALPETLPADIRRHLGLVPLAEALWR